MKEFILSFICLLVALTIGVLPLIISVVTALYFIWPCDGMTFIEIWREGYMWRFIFFFINVIFGLYSSGRLFVAIHVEMKSRLKLL